MLQTKISRQLNCGIRIPGLDFMLLAMSTQYSPSIDRTQFWIDVSTEMGDFTVPSKGSITLNGTESKVLVTDFRVSSSGKKITYATLEVLTLADLGDRHVVVFWAPEGEEGEFLLDGSKSGRVVSMVHERPLGPGIRPNHWRSKSKLWRSVS
jgi:hypothetical protein